MSKITITHIQRLQRNLFLFFTLFLLYFFTGCKNPKPARDIEGTYNGNYAIAGIGNGQATVDLTAISDDKINLNFSGAGLDPIIVNGISVSEQTTNNYGLVYTDAIYTLAGVVEERELLTFQYTGDTLFMTFNGDFQ